MFKTHSKYLLSIFSVFVLLCGIAEARAGGGRSSGRSGGGYGSRGYSRSPSQTPYSNGNYGNRPMGNTPGYSGGGGFMRGLAGGIAGGFLGSMLFGSLGRAGTGMGGGGGFGLLELLLVAGFAYFGFRWWKNRQQTTAYAQSSAQTGIPASGGRPFWQSASSPVMETTATMHPDEASDIFFKIQGAWTRRDLTSVRELLGSEMYDIMNRDLIELKAKKRINRLENISVRGAEIVDLQNESGTDYATARFTANLLDYTVDETTGKVVDGNDTVPVKFEEEWTFAKNANHPSWQLVGIQQV